MITYITNTRITYITNLPFEKTPQEVRLAESTKWDKNTVVLYDIVSYDDTHKNKADEIFFVGILWVQDFLSLIIRVSETFSRGYFAELKIFLMDISRATREHVSEE